MATGIVQPPTPACHFFPAKLKIMKMIKPLRLVSAPHLRIQSFRYREYPYELRLINSFKAAEQSSGIVDNVLEDQGRPSADNETVSQIKSELNQMLQGINRGIFGVTSAKKSEIEGLVKLLESQNPTSDPTENLDKVSGSWKLVYSTITILGAKRTKLGLRDFVSLGDFIQTIDVSEGKAINVIEFSVRGLKILKGHLKIEASFKIASKSRVDIEFNDSTITPDQLMNVFTKNYDLLLSIFNPNGWLEISYVDETMRIGRDDKGNIFIMERLGQQNT